jgi:glycosyltransferase involved in cell wall biosynthesis
MSIKLSAVIITKNEAHRIGQCIKSLQNITDDIVIVDSGSTDTTKAISRKLGAKIYETEWRGYGPTKNMGHSKAQNDWIISVDADELMTDELAKEIMHLELESNCVYALNRQNYYLGKKIKHSGWSPDWVYRIFNRKEVKWNDNLVHEKLILPDHMKIIRLKHKLIHHSYDSIEDHMSKIENYAHLRAQIWIEQKKHPSLLKKWFGPAFKGFKSYILQLGYLDGKAGWTIAKMNTRLVRRQLYYFDKLQKSKH